MNPTTPQQKQQVSPQSNTAQPSMHLVSGLYWNKSRWNGSKSVPVVLELTSDAFIMYDRDDNQVFNVPLTAVQARFTSIGSLYLTVNGVRYYISGIGTAISPDFSTIQKERLQKFNTSVGLLRGTIGASGLESVALATNNLPLGTVSGVAGGVMATKAMYDDGKLLNEWYTAFQQAGVQVTGKRAHMMRFFFITIAATSILLIIMFYVISRLTAPSSS